jgi:hypothetical protein
VGPAGTLWPQESPGALGHARHRAFGQRGLGQDALVDETVAPAAVESTHDLAGILWDSAALDDGQCGRSRVAYEVSYGFPPKTIRLLATSVLVVLVTIAAPMDVWLRITVVAFFGGGVVLRLRESDGGRVVY